MAYDAAKAHEYYMKYRKKGLKKGRKKGSKKKSSTKKTNLVGLSNSGLNDQGKMQWALAKEKLKSDMNAALAKAKTPEEQAKIRQEYQNKALAELTKMKSDPSMAKAKATKTAKISKSSAKTSSKSSGSSKGSSSSKESSSSSSSTKAVQQATEQMQQAVKQMQDYVKQLTEKLLGGTTADGESIESKLSTLTEEQRQQVKQSIEDTIAAIKKKVNKE